MASSDTFAGATQIPHSAVRLDFVVADPFSEVRDRFESAVPPFDPAVLGDADGWEEIKHRTSTAATNAFLRYARLDGGPIFSRAGHTTPCTTYLMGNHVYAEMMFRHDPGILLYAPLRVTIFEDKQGRTHLTVDQPSTRFGSFGHPDIAAVGKMLDERLSELLNLLGVSAPVAV